MKPRFCSATGLRRLSITTDVWPRGCASRERHSRGKRDHREAEASPRRMWRERRGDGASRRDDGAGSGSPSVDEPEGQGEGDRHPVPDLPHRHGAKHDHLQADGGGTAARAASGYSPAWRVPLWGSRQSRGAAGEPRSGAGESGTTMKNSTPRRQPEQTDGRGVPLVHPSGRGRSPRGPTARKRRRSAAGSPERQVGGRPRPEHSSRGRVTARHAIRSEVPGEAIQGRLPAW